MARTRKRTLIFNVILHRRKRNHFFFYLIAGEKISEADTTRMHSRSTLTKDTTVGALLRDDVRYFKMLASTNCGEGEIEETHLVTNPVVAFRFKDHVDRS